MKKKPILYKPRILLLDDEIAFHHRFRFVFEEHYDIHSVSEMVFLWDRLSKQQFDLLLFDLALDGRNYRAGIDRIVEVKEKYPNLPLIVVTKNENRDTVVNAVLNGASDFIYKKEFKESNWFEKWDEKFNRHINRKTTTTKNKENKEDSLDTQLFIGESNSIKEVKRKLEFLANYEDEITILLTGETGVGKEVAAQYFHKVGNKSQKPFIVVNLSTIQETLIESTLFGHKKGAFTNADTDKMGYFHQAQDGILFLDEIGDISLNMQVKLLRFIQDKTIRIVGSDEDIKLNVQIIAATNRNLKEMIANKEFREDFYQRFTYRIEIPSLRKRKEDVEILLRHFLNIEKTAPLEKYFTSEALEILKENKWKGNIRELINTLKTAKLNKEMLGKIEIDKECLPINSVSLNLDTKVSKPELDFNSLEEHKAYIELERIEKHLLESYNKKGITAKKMGIDTDALRYLINKQYKSFPKLFNQFPNIVKSYKLNIK